MTSTHSPTSRVASGTNGLALSGGGFRATAFHLGVLRRMRELGCLQKIDVVSTVSGGSIAGAAWVHWQWTHRYQPDTDEDWAEFESRMVELMTSGLRESVMLQGFIVPSVLAALVFCGAARALGTGWGGYSVAVLGAIAVGYLVWHYVATRLLERAYDRHLFHAALVSDLATPDTEAVRRIPRLVVNATVLNTGQLGVFSPDHPVKGPESWTPRSVADGMRVERLRERGAPVPFPCELPIAKVVAASSCFPGAFASVSIAVKENALDLGGEWFHRSRRPYAVQLVDGGVFDNQGTQALIDVKCDSIIVSDASSLIQVKSRPSTWQLLPLGSGAVSRVLAIMYERVKALGLRRLAESGAHRRILNLDPYGDTWKPGIPALPPTIRWFLARVRTDLDRFSPMEVLTLMAHGYAATQHQVSTLNLEDGGHIAKPFQFHSTDSRTEIDWVNLMKPGAEDGKWSAEMLFILRHLEASNSRNSTVRAMRRYLNRRRPPAFFGFAAMGLSDQPREIRKAAHARFRAK